uniref:Uncharacterized protein n=1 Tax=Salix viminalis TaxID=40686 RepID=A0A6N2K0M8_SALVM
MRSQGFAAKLKKEEARAMEKKEGFVSAWPQNVLNVKTTYTPNFLGLQQNLGFWNHSNYGKGVHQIILHSAMKECLPHLM